MSTAFFGGGFFGGGFFGGEAAAVSSGSAGSWKRRGRLGEAKFLRFRDSQHPSEIKKRKREEEEAAKREVELEAFLARNAPEQRVPSINDVGPGSLQGISPRGIEIKREDWAGKSNALAAQKAAQEAEQRRKEKARAEEEEYALMTVLLHGRR